MRKVSFFLEFLFCKLPLENRRFWIIRSTLSKRDRLRQKLGSEMEKLDPRIEDIKQKAHLLLCFAEDFLESLSLKQFMTVFLSFANRGVKRFALLPKPLRPKKCEEGQSRWLVKLLFSRKQKGPFKRNLVKIMKTSWAI